VFTSWRDCHVIVYNCDTRRIIPGHVTISVDLWRIVLWLTTSITWTCGLQRVHVNHLRVKHTGRPQWGLRERDKEGVTSYADYHIRCIMCGIGYACGRQLYTHMTQAYIHRDSRENSSEWVRWLSTCLEICKLTSPNFESKLGQNMHVHCNETRQSIRTIHGLQTGAGTRNGQGLSEMQTKADMREECWSKSLYARPWSKHYI